MNEPHNKQEEPNEARGRAHTASFDSSASSSSSQQFQISECSAFGRNFHQKQTKNRQRDSLLKAMTVNIGLLHTKWSGSRITMLTKPCETRKDLNNGKDNEEGNLIISTNDVLNGRFVVKDMLGQGTFGQVVRCEDLENMGQHVAVKVIKNKKAYLRQAKIEIRILEVLQQYEPEKHHIVRMLSHFYHENHLCIVFERLKENLFELIKSNRYNGLSTNVVRVFAAHILDALSVLSQARIIHCDLKPENILLTDQTPHIKVIDFGSACMENDVVYSYIQSRFYRSPEVLFGCEYDMSIDMWSFGCICAELFLGLPLFPGVSQYNQVFLIMEMFGYPPLHMIEMAKSSHKYFKRLSQPRNDLDPERGDSLYVLKTEEEYCQENNCQPKPWKRYFNYSKLDEVIFNYTYKKNMSAKEHQKEEESRHALIDFLQGLLRWDPMERWTPMQVLQHPFIKNKPLREPFVPDVDPIKEQRRQLMLQRYRIFRQQLHQQQGPVQSVPSAPPNGRRPSNGFQIISGYFDQPPPSPSIHSFSPHVHNSPLYGYRSPRQQTHGTPLGVSPAAVGAGFPSFNAGNVGSAISNSGNSNTSSYPIPIPHHHQRNQRHQHPHHSTNNSVPRVPLGQSPYGTPPTPVSLGQSPYGQSPSVSGSHGKQQHGGSMSSQLQLGASPSAASFMQQTQRQRGAAHQQSQLAMSPRNRSVNSPQQLSTPHQQQIAPQSVSHQPSAIHAQASPHGHYHQHYLPQQMSPQQYTPPQQYRRKHSNTKKPSSQQQGNLGGNGGNNSASKPPKAPRHNKGGNNSGDMDNAFGSFDPDFSPDALLGDESGTPPSSSFVRNPYYQQQQQPPFHGVQPQLPFNSSQQGIPFGTPTQFDTFGMSPSAASGFALYGVSPANLSGSLGHSANNLLGSSHGSYGNSGQYHVQQSGSFGNQRGIGGSYGSSGQQQGKK